MSQTKFKSQNSIAETAEQLGKQALALGLISDFSIHFYADTWQFYLKSESNSEPLTPEEAYLYLKKIVDKQE